ncbi:MAG TPA: hypothetical protein VH436_00755 [Vicinamibacterales bacterium]
MWTWFRGMRSDRRDAPIADTSFVERRIGMSTGKYLALYRYLENRYADVTVLTFEQIEALLGFALPPLARTHQGWWATRAATADAPHSAAWILAGRTATPNLLAKTVIFERTAAVSRKRG